MAWLSNLLGRRGDPAHRAVELAERLNRQRVMWLDAVHLELSEAKAIALNSPEQTVSSSEIASAFQAVLVLSLVQANKYIRTAEMAHFAKALCAGLTNGELTDSWLGATDRYTNLKKRPMGEQLLTLSEEIAGSVTGSTATAMLLGPELMLSSNEFMYRSLGVASDHFGDDATTHRIARVVSMMHEEQPVADSTSSVPESLEEKATSAPTLWRVVMEATDLRLQRRFPNLHDPG